jgi:RES domain-containing protein
MTVPAVEPLLTTIAIERTIRLVASARLRSPVLRRLVGAARAADLAEIEGATSGRLIQEARGSDLLAARELVSGLPHAAFINAAFAYWRPRELNRFNQPGRGAWYAALAVETCIKEVAFHMTRELARVNVFDATVDYAEMFASFAGLFADLRKAKPKPACLDADPAIGYPAGNAFADAVRAKGANGIVYPSVRHAQGTCLVALWPSAVQSVAQGRVLRLQWKGGGDPEVSILE